MTRRIKGQGAYLAGLCAEDSVARLYADRGCALRESRWRGDGGEIDLIFDRGAETVFVEVKAARDFAAAAAMLRPGQVARLWRAAEEYLGTLAGPAPRECRFDVALVDRAGRVDVIENAFA